MILCYHYFKLGVYLLIRNQVTYFDLKHKFYMKLKKKNVVLKFKNKMYEVNCLFNNKMHIISSFKINLNCLTI